MLEEPADNWIRVGSVIHIPQKIFLIMTYLINLVTTA